MLFYVMSHDGIGMGTGWEKVWGGVLNWLDSVGKNQYGYSRGGLGLR